MRLTKQPDMLTCVIAPPSLSIVSLSLYSLTLMHCNFFMPTSLHASTAWRQLLDSFSQSFDYNQFSFSFATRTEINLFNDFWFLTYGTQKREGHKGKGDTPAEGVQLRSQPLNLKSHPKCEEKYNEKTNPKLTYETMFKLYVSVHCSVDCIAAIYHLVLCF